MTIDDLNGNEMLDSQDRKIDGLRRELESMLENENIKLEEKIEKAFLRMDQIARKSIEDVAAEWSSYEIMLSSAREDLFCKSRKEMARLFDLQNQKGNEDESVRKILEKILQMEPFEKVVSGK